VAREREVLGGDADAPQLLFVTPEAPVEPGPDARQPPEPLGREAAQEVEARGQREADVEPFVDRREEALGPARHVELLLALDVERHPAQRRLDARRKLAHLVARRLAVLVQVDGEDFQRLAEAQQRLAAERSLRSVIEPDGHDAQAELPRLVMQTRLPRAVLVFVRDRGRAEGDARRAGLDRQELRRVVRDAFGEERDGAAAPEQAAARLEGAPVLREVGRGVGAAVERQRLDRAQQRADGGQVEERGLGEKRDAARQRGEDERRVNEAVRVVEDEDERAFGRRQPRAARLDAAEEEAQGDAHEGPHEPLREPPFSPPEHVEEAQDSRFLRHPPSWSQKRPRFTNRARRAARPT
jgi:hypothetical protein